jgi:hypothetical protein
MAMSMSREDREAVVAVVRAGVVPAVHLTEGHAHLLEDVLFLDAGADQVRLDLLDELLELVAGHVVVDQRAVLDVVGGALVVVVVAELVAGADHFHAQILVGADHVTRTQAADEQHDLLALQARLVLGDHRVHQRAVLGDDLLGVGLDGVVEVAGDLAQALLDHRRAEEVVLDPGNAVLLFHVPADVVHRAVAVQHVELGLGGVLQLGDGAVAGPLGDHAQAHLLEQDAAGPGVAADVVVADDGHVVGVDSNGRLFGSVLSNTQSRIASLAMWWPSDCDTPRKPSQRTGTMVLPSYSLAFFFETASMSSPIRPIGHSTGSRCPCSAGTGPGSRR